MARRLSMQALIKRLSRQGLPPGLPPTRDPFELILWEQVAYLADDLKRGAAFGALRDRVGSSPDAILEAPLRTLEAIARQGGGTAVKERAKRMRESARMAREQWGGDLRTLLGRDAAEARRALGRFPMIGPPGADKILMLTGACPILSLDSNGLRVLLRLGYGEEARSYAATYKSVQEAAMADCGKKGCEWLAEAHGLLRSHGKITCKSRPLCGDCAVRKDCPAALA